MNQAGPMFNLHTNGHPHFLCLSPCKRAAGSAFRGGCSHTTAFTDAQASQSCCSVEVADAAVTTSSTPEHDERAEQPAVALTWPHLRAGIALGSGGADCHGAGRAAAAVTAAHGGKYRRQQEQQQLTLLQHQPQKCNLHHGSTSYHKDKTVPVFTSTLSAPAESWLEQHAAIMAQWRLLTEPNQDETSLTIRSCSSPQQLLGVAQKLLKRPASKWHYARLAAMAAVLAVPSAQGQALLPAQQQGSWAAQPVPALVGLQDLQHDQHSAVIKGSNSRPDVLENRVQQQQEQQHLALQQDDALHHRIQQEQQQQQQQQQEQVLYDQLVCTVVQAVTNQCVNTGAPALHLLRGVHLAETLHAVQLLRQHACSAEVLQAQQQLLQQHLVNVPGPALLSAVHACRTPQQLQSVVQLTSAQLSPLHVKATFVQLARCTAAKGADTSSGASSSSSSVLFGQLLELLELHAPALQAHQCASILWSMGQLQERHIHAPITGSSSRSRSSGFTLPRLQQQLLQGALAGLGTLNARVCSQLLHGAAKLQLQLSDVELLALQQHAQQQLQLCGPQTLSSMLWAFATLQQPGDPQLSHDWLQAFYNSSWRWLQQQQQPAASSNVESSIGSADGLSDGNNSSNGSSSSSGSKQQQEDQGSPEKGSSSCFGPVELSALLTAVCRLQLQPPGAWLAAVAGSSRRQMDRFNQQELALLLWAFAKLQYVPPSGLLSEAAARAMQLDPCSFSPQNMTLMLYGVSRIQQWQLQAHAEAAGQAWQQPGMVLDVLAAAGGSQVPDLNAVDLPLMAWSLGMQQVLCKRQKRAAGQDSVQAALPVQEGQQQEQLEQLDGLCLQSLLQAATARLLQPNLTPQGISMLLWGLGTALQHTVNTVDRAGHRHHAQQWRPQQGPQLLPQPHVLAGFAEAAALAAARHAAVFSRHELCSVVWGLGAVIKSWQLATSGAASVASTAGRASGSPNSCAAVCVPSPAVSECLDLLSCQLLDAAEQLSNSQLVSALQGLAWSRHPRGMDLLHTAVLPMRSAVKLQTAQPQELLVLLRACVAYRFVPQSGAWGACIAALQRLRLQLLPGELVQVLYLLGKLQMLSNRKQKQRALQAAAAAAVAAAAAGDSLGAWQSTSRQREQEQQQQHVVLKQLVPHVLLDKLLPQVASGIEHCHAKDVSLMLWGVSHLQWHQHQLSDRASRAVGTTADQVGPLLSKVYPYVLQHRRQFEPGNLATLLYAMHRLGARPPQAWLHTVALQFDSQGLGSMDGQSLAVLALALAGLNWVPPHAWVDAYVQAVAAADRRGGLMSRWQRRCISNGLAALNPMASQSWLH